MYSILRANTKWVDLQLSDHFLLSEFRCHCGDVPSTSIYSCGGAVVIPQEEFIDKLERVREKVGKIVITRGYSCFYWNKHVGGKDKSFHSMYNQRFSKYGAADLKFPELQQAFPENFLDVAQKIIKEVGFKGIILHRGQKFIHVDLRLTPYIVEERE